jgi:hypothetical protein
MLNATEKIIGVLNYSSGCHSLDRLNLIAHKDCGAPVIAPDEKQLFSEAVDS